MSELPTESITAEVLRRLAGTPDPRLKSISEALVRHLHAFIEEVRPSVREWEHAIEFLTAVGQKCTRERQEFILLSDTLGASMLVDAINAPDDPRATESTVLGPFYRDDPPHFENGAIIDAGKDGDPLFIEGEVIDTTGIVFVGRSLTCGNRIPRALTMSSTLIPRPIFEADLPVIRKVVFRSGRSFPRATRFQTTDRWARCSRPRQDIRIARRTYISGFRRAIVCR